MTAKPRIVSSAPPSGPPLEGKQHFMALARLLARRLARQMRQGHSFAPGRAGPDSQDQAPPRE